MDTALDIYQIKTPEGIAWEHVLKIYLDAFPEPEREPPSLVSERVSSSRYLLFVAVSHRTPIGFYILDHRKQLDCTLLCYLAIKAEFRNAEIGTRLFQHAVSIFHKKLTTTLLLVEVEQEHFGFYLNQNLSKIAIHYLAPRFCNGNNIPLQLMCLPRSRLLRTLSGSWLANIIEDLYLSNYGLTSENELVQEQLSEIPAVVKLMKR